MPDEWQNTILNLLRPAVMKPYLIMRQDEWFRDYWATRERFNPKITEGMIIPKRSAKTPRKGELVNYDDRLGTIGWVTEDEVNVFFGDKLEAFDRDYFYSNYNSPRGKTVWKI